MDIETRAQFDRKTIEDIDHYGRSVICVHRCFGCEGPSFSYTIGNHLKGLPELLVIGSSRAFYLNALSRLMISRGHGFDEGELIQLLELMLPLKLVHVTDLVAWDVYTVQASNFLGHDNYPIMQAVLPDKQGRFPPECEPPWSLFPILNRGR